MTSASRETLGSIHSKLAQRMLSYLERAESDPEFVPDPRMVNAIIKFLHDNGIEALAGQGDTPMEKLRAIAGGKSPVLPFGPKDAATASE